MHRILLPLVTVSVFALSACATSPVIPPSTNSDVIVSSPAPNTVIKSPLLVRGKARGTWFFEASLPVQVTDADGNILATVPGQAEGEWMTTDYVSFTATLTFTTSATSGFVIIAKDNPSGLPENDAQVKIPVKF